jgi:hypothetical protein
MVAFSDFDQMNLIDKDGLLAKTFNQIKIKSPERTTNQNTTWLSESLFKCFTNNKQLD